MKLGFNTMRYTGKLLIYVDKRNGITAVFLLLIAYTTCKREDWK